MEEEDALVNDHEVEGRVFRDGVFEDVGADLSWGAFEWAWVEVFSRGRGVAGRGGWCHIVGYVDVVTTEFDGFGWMSVCRVQV